MNEIELSFVSDRNGIAWIKQGRFFCPIISFLDENKVYKQLNIINSIDAQNNTIILEKIINGKEDKNLESDTEEVEIPSNENGVKFDCGRSFCGCWSESTIHVLNVRLTENDDTALEDSAKINLLCINSITKRESEPEVLAINSGIIQLSLRKRYSPGCGGKYTTLCRALAISDSNGIYESLTFDRPKPNNIKSGQDDVHIRLDRSNER